MEKCIIYAPGKYKNIQLVSKVSITSISTSFLLKLYLHCNFHNFRHFSITSVEGMLPFKISYIFCVLLACVQDTTPWDPPPPLDSVENQFCLNFFLPPIIQNHIEELFLICIFTPQSPHYMLARISVGVCCQSLDGAARDYRSHTNAGFH